jgi:hypothetical protein
MHNCTYWLRPATPPSPRIWAHIRGRYLSAKSRRHLCVTPCCLLVFRARIFELLRSPRIDYKEPIQVTQPGGPVRQSYSYSVPSPHKFFKNSSTGVMKPVLTLCCGRVLATLSRYHWKLLHFSLFLKPHLFHSFSSITYWKRIEKVIQGKQSTFLK